METPRTIIALGNESGAEKSKNEIVAQQQAGTYKVATPEYSDAERLFRNQIIWELCLARDQRDRYHPELDNMTYIEYYESNRKKDLSYIPPKRNKEDVRIVTGTTRDKDTDLLNGLLDMNLESDITAFDDADMVVNDLGTNMSDMVRKSREIEEWKRKRSVVYREFISQGDVFIQELYKQDFRNMPISEVTWDPNVDSIKDFNVTKRVQKISEQCESRMVNGKKVYLGNIRCPFIEDQQLVAVLNVYPRAQAEARYRNWERWKHVPYTIDTVSAFYDDGKTYKDWNLITLNDQDRVAEIFVYWKERNIFMILLNGVLMLPIDYPLTAVSPTGEVPMAQGKLEPISDFAYSKSHPSKTKISQEVLDEITKLMIQKSRQSYRPPLGNRGKKVYSGSIFTAGRITTDVTEGELFPLLPNFSNGISVSDFSFYKMIKEGIDENTTSKQFGGHTTPEDPQTATQTLELKQQQMLQLGLWLDGVCNLERRMTWNRIYNILSHWTRECDASIDDVKQGIYEGYKTFSVGAPVDNGQKGVRIFRQTTKGYPAIDDHELEEEKLSKEYGQPVRITYLNPKMLRTIPYKWHITVKPVPNSNDTLSKLLFVQNLEKAIELFGPQSINQDYAKQRFAIMNNEDYNKFFVKQSLQNMLNPGAAAAVPGALGQGQAPAGGGASPAAAGAKIGMRPNGQQVQPMMR